MTSSILTQDQVPSISYVKGYRSRGRWYFYLRPPAHLSALDGIPLGHSEAEARERVERLIKHLPRDPGIDPISIPRGRQRYENSVMDMLSSALIRAKKNAAQKKLEFAIDRNFLCDLVAAQGWRCAVSGIRFRHRTEFGKPASREPFKPSIDRITNSKGYVPDNCRIVLVAVNVALGAWGDVVFNEIVRRSAERLHRANPVEEFRQAAIRIVNGK